MCKVPENNSEYYEDSLLPKYSREGIPMRDPRDINDPDYDRPVGNVASENFEFDFKQGVGQVSNISRILPYQLCNEILLKSAEEEQRHYEDYVGKFGDARFSDFAPKVQNRDFSVSNNPDEWKFVERLFPQSLIPQVEKSDSHPSGFKLPSISPEEAMEKYQYFVGRTVNHMIPVYTEVFNKFPQQTDKLLTKVRKVDGNLFQLKDDLDQFLFDRYKMKFPCQVSELQHHVLYWGDFEEEFKEFLLNKGF